MICAAVCFSLALLCVTYAWWVTQQNWKQQRDLHHHYRDACDFCIGATAELRQKLNAANDRAADLEANLLLVGKQRDREIAKRGELLMKYDEQSELWSVTRRTILEAIRENK